MATGNTNHDLNSKEANLLARAEMAVGLQTEINVTGAISAGLSWSFVGRRSAGADAPGTRCCRLRWPNPWLSAIASSDGAGLNANLPRNGTRNSHHDCSPFPRAV